MNSLQKWMHKLSAVILLLSASLITAQTTYKESFKVGDDVLVSVNTSHTNVVFETWNQDKVEVYAFIDDEDLSEKEKEEIFKNWDLDILGNSRKVVITSNHGSLWGGVESLGSLKALERMESLESLKGLEALKELGNMPLWDNFGDMDWNIAVPDVPELEEFPEWPFSGDRPNFKNGNEYNYFSDHSHKSYTFDRGEYKRNKQAYVDKLNKKHKSNATVKQVDNWLNDVDEWSKNIEEVMEEWGENFGKKFDQKFGPEFEKKMEKWGEEFGKSMEAWGEAFGEKFGEEMEKWGEEFGKDMEKWGEEFGKDMEKWAEEFEKNGYNYSQEVQTDENGNKSIIIQGNKGSKGGLFHDHGKKAKKTIIIKMPKGSKTEINVRHGEVKMADVSNIKATLNYSAFTANSIDGGESLIDASYAPVMINNWVDGALNLKFVEDCRLNKVDKINVMANSSDVNINKLNKEAFLSGSFGNLFISEIADNFESVDIVLENTDATLNLPNSAFTFYYNGAKSRFEAPAEIEITTKNKNSNRTHLKGFHKSKNTQKSLTINASYSNVKMQ
ncbi:MAG: hypothetical protein HKN48_07960 [Flavobacteriaceae bacterium]|nr:hypothetical protein [Flavobacteriaceae bacterium]